MSISCRDIVPADARLLEGDPLNIVGFIQDLLANMEKLNVLLLLLESILFWVKQRILWTVQTKLATSKRF
jgi:hypothetical protein